MINHKAKATYKASKSRLPDQSETVVCEGAGQESEIFAEDNDGKNAIDKYGTGI
jgi:hypothetical protein